MLWHILKIESPFYYGGGEINDAALSILEADKDEMTANITRMIEKMKEGLTCFLYEFTSIEDSIIIVEKVRG